MAPTPSSNRCMFFLLLFLITPMVNLFSPFALAHPGDHWFGPQEKLHLDVRAKKIFEKLLDEFKTQIILSECISSSHVKSRLSLTAKSLDTWIQEERLLALSSNGQVYFPQWQLDANSPTGTLPGLQEVIKSLGKKSSLAKISWFCASHGRLWGLSPRQALEEGLLDLVLEVAEEDSE